MKLNRIYTLIFVSLFGINYFTACNGRQVILQQEDPTTNNKTTSGEISFAAIKPVFQQFCVDCHVSGGQPDFSDYAKAKFSAAKIKSFVSSGYMPQKPSPEADAITEEARNAIVSWVNAGAPLEAIKAPSSGDTPDMPAGPELPPILELTNQCMSCHGGSGISSSEAYPNLAGQDKNYLISQLKQFRDGTRQNPTMSAFAKDLSDNEIIGISNLFASFDPSAENPNAADEIEQKLFGDVKRPVGVTTCAGCHASPAYQSRPIPALLTEQGTQLYVPTITGQKAGYIASQLKSYFNGDRANDIMKQVTHQSLFTKNAEGELQPDQEVIDAIADYYSKLPLLKIND